METGVRKRKRAQDSYRKRKKRAMERCVRGREEKENARHLLVDEDEEGRAPDKLYSRLTRPAIDAFSPAPLKLVSAPAIACHSCVVFLPPLCFPTLSSPRYPETDTRCRDTEPTAVYV